MLQKNRISWNGSNLRWLLRLLALAATGVSIYLLSVSLSGGTVAGCGAAAEVDCDDLIGGRWGGWLDLPVSVGGVMTYGMLLIFFCLQGLFGSFATIHRMQQMIVGLCVLASTCALWFIGLLLFLLEGFCIYCLFVHGCGIVIATLVFWKVQWMKPKPYARKKLHPTIVPAACGLLGTMILITGQLIYIPEEYEIETLEALPIEVVDNAKTGRETVDIFPSDGPVETQSVDLEIEEPLKTLIEESRTIVLAGGRIRLNMDEVPVLGPTDTKSVAALMFDYTCKPCRALHHKISQAIKQFDNQLAVAMIPLPLDSTCNRHVTKTKPDHQKACEYAKLALVVWKEKPIAFAEYDDFLTTGKTPPAIKLARTKAAEILQTEDLNALLNQPEIAAWITRNVGWYGVLKEGAIPKLLLPDKVLTGKVESLNVLCHILEHEYAGLQAHMPPAPDTAKDLTDFGMVLLHDKEYEQALSRFQQALALDANYAKAITGLGQVYQFKRDYAAAIREYRRACQLDSKDILAMYNLAWILATDPDYGPDNQEEALDLASQAAQLYKKKNIIILNTLSAAYANAQQFEEAISTIDEAIALARAKNYQKHIVDMIKQRQFYKNGQPFRIKK